MRGIEKPILYLSEKNDKYAIAVYPDGSVCLVNTEHFSQKELEEKFRVEKDEKKYSQIFKGYFLTQTG